MKAALEGAQDQLERLKPPPEPTGRKRPITPKAAGSAAAARDGWSAQRAPKKVALGDSVGLDKSDKLTLKTTKYDEHFEYPSGGSGTEEGSDDWWELQRVALQGCLPPEVAKEWAVRLSDMDFTDLPGAEEWSHGEEDPKLGWFKDNCHSHVWNFSPSRGQGGRPLVRSDGKEEENETAATRMETYRQFVCNNIWNCFSSDLAGYKFFHDELKAMKIECKW